jgi:mRNA interferase RelE/StbE
MVTGRFRSAPTKHFLRELKKLPAHVRARILLAIEDIMSNPYAGVRLRGELDGLLRWRTGDYRIIYKIDEEKHLVVLIDVGSRKSVYG